MTTITTTSIPTNLKSFDGEFHHPEYMNSYARFWVKHDSAIFAEEFLKDLALTIFNNEEDLSS